MKSKVYFAGVHTQGKQESLLAKMRRLFDRAGFGDMISRDDIVAIKIHFGEKGNTAYIRPTFARQIVDKIKEKGGKPFLTDSNTLYNGSRANGVDHYNTAIYNGFSYAVVNAPIIIADGIHSNNFIEVRIDKKHFESVKISKEIGNVSKMIVLSHFKGHENAGIGGAIKNLAMGCAPAAGKQQQHSAIKPKVSSKCVGCSTCLEYCPVSAITKEGGKALIGETCIGCGECISICPIRAISPQWSTEIPIFLERMVEYAYGAVRNKGDNVGYINVLMNITPLCDCYGFSGAYIVPDIGILASKDPVAIDAASYDLVNEQSGNLNSSLKCNHEKGEDKFRGLYSSIDTVRQFSYGEEIGLGNKEYELINI
ncbi:MAG TPA: DUF362 domain-containing protein [Bacillota bacterium]|nr:DUF362 domain-containing protein [Bacillota bacterium]HPL52597.1 DUF362 domain-containing protein [Bacillota bacterium]